jgi:tRNA 2-selenouridine synthase
VSFQQIATVTQLRDFDEAIDVRSPAEFALDHVPGALNCPVLSNEERARVGTTYQQDSAFEAKRIGAALVARNIAFHLEATLRDRPRNWRPLVYCWRGGGRSAAMSEVLSRVGWRCATLEGGYRAFRRHVITALDQLAGSFRFHVICGKTGSAKSQVLEALRKLGGQVLDLEGIARHRGSVLGEIPGYRQPSQKMFESLLWDQLSRFDPQSGVFVEAESRKIGNVQVPPALIQSIRAAPCAVLEAAPGVRVKMLIEQYSHFLQDPEGLCRRLSALIGHHGEKTVGQWQRLAHAGAHEQLVTELLQAHYDPSYERSAQRNFDWYDSAAVVQIVDGSAADIESAARTILDRMGTVYSVAQ